MLLRAILLFLIPATGFAQVCNPDFPSDYSYQQSACFPKTLQFTTSLTNVKSYRWTFGDGQTSVSTNPSITYSKFGVYTVALTVAYINGCSETVSKVVPVLAEQDSLVVSNNIAICRGDSVALQTKSSGFDSCWESSSSLRINAFGTAIAKPVVPTFYVFNSRKLGDNLVYNGNFSLGNKGFTSAYGYNPASGLYEGYYTISNNPSTWHRDFKACGDHTTGSGNMMVINGATEENLKVWEQTVQVTPNSNYVFYTWLETVAESYPPNAALLQFSINGQLLGNPFSADLKPCIWQQFYSTWNSGSNTTATIQVVNKNVVAGGNDFALDDIFFGKITMKTDTVKVSFKSARVNDTTVGICPQQTYKLPSGRVVQNPGMYVDTATTGKCDTLITKLRLVINAPVSVSKTAEICAGNTYLLPSGRVVRTTGVYKDTLRYILSGCDSVITTVNLTVKPVLRPNVSATICNGQSYTLPSGQVAKTTGVYKDTLRYSTGCDSLITTLNLVVQKPSTSNPSPVICEGQSYKMPSGIVAKATGVYNDTLRYSTGCDSIVYTINLTVQKLYRKDTSAIICAGDSYRSPSGRLIKTTGIYNDTLHYRTGCDSLITTINLIVKPVYKTTTSATICNGQTYTLPSGRGVGTKGTYVDTVRYSMGCDSLITTLNLVVQTASTSNLLPVICEGQFFKMPSGVVAKTTGVYKDTLRYTTGCDSILYTVNLTVQKVYRKDTSTIICAGDSYRSPSGRLIKVTGIYKDTLRYKSGCDSLINTIDLLVKPVYKTTTSATICGGQSYTLPSGRVVGTKGTYVDTVRYSMGCDSLITTLNLVVQTASSSNLSPAICEGQSFKMPSGVVVRTTGTYKDTLLYITGCDSLIYTVNLTVQKVYRKDTSAIICAGDSYRSPSGRLIKATGIYNDTLRYKSGCDSLITNIDLLVKPVYKTSTSATICNGQTYTLPSGRIVGTKGTYLDTVRYSMGCDSLITTLNLVIQTASTSNLSPVICEGQSYKMPSGIVAKATGVYKDTLRYTTGCDSIVYTINLTVQKLYRKDTSAIVCAGDSYRSPSGRLIKTMGIYNDTLRYQTGCDSLITTINLTVKPVYKTTTSATICDKQFYTLPSGRAVGVKGTYLDTVRYSMGCDSLITTLNLVIQTASTSNLLPVICEGQSFKMPSGVVVRTTGTYKDTLRYTAGCDSLIFTVSLTVQKVYRKDISATICSGQAYKLSSGKIVQTTGIYNDTLRYLTGCDSLITTVDLLVQRVYSISKSAQVCVGESYMLPSGRLVNTSGVYEDTVRYVSGCDSLISTVNLKVNSFTTLSKSVSVCYGQSYMLPSGRSVSSPGNYRDTVRYYPGCDSLISIITLSVETSTVNKYSATLCAGQPYTLPSGKVASVSGIYNDTLHSRLGCDSSIAIVELTFTKPEYINESVSICEGETYTTLWGDLVTSSGTYRKTITSMAGCDSVVFTTRVTVKPKPVVRVSKSNDIYCNNSYATLSVSSAGKYKWIPSSSLDNSQIQKPIASPTVTTMYKAQVTASNGCTAEDSIEVKVLRQNPEGSFLVPNAFTPNNDGLNDYFGIKDWTAVSDLKFTIFNRWGILIFQTTDPSKCWDGKYNGMPQSSGAYAYQISGNSPCGPVFRKGIVMLIR